MKFGFQNSACFFSFTYQSIRSMFGCETYSFSFLTIMWNKGDAYLSTLSLKLSMRDYA